MDGMARAQGKKDSTGREKTNTEDGKQSPQRTVASSARLEPGTSPQGRKREDAEETDKMQDVAGQVGKVRGSKDVRPQIKKTSSRGGLLTDLERWKTCQLLTQNTHSWQQLFRAKQAAARRKVCSCALETRTKHRAEKLKLRTNVNQH